MEILKKLNTLKKGWEGKKIATCIKIFINEGLTDEEKNILKQILFILDNVQNNFEKVRLIGTGKKGASLLKGSEKEIAFFKDTGLTCCNVSSISPYFSLKKGQMRLVFKLKELSDDDRTAQLIVGKRDRVFEDLLNSL